MIAIKACLKRWVLRAFLNVGSVGAVSSKERGQELKMPCHPLGSGGLKEVGFSRSEASRRGMVVKTRARLLRAL